MSDIEFSWLVGRSRLNLRTLHSAQQAFSSIHSTELADPTEFTSPGALILTVGLAFKDSDLDFSHYAGRLAQAGVRGIGFGTGLVFERVPDELVRAAAQHGLELIEVPRATAFVDIINHVTAEKTRREHNAQFALHRQQEELNHAAINGLGALMQQGAKTLRSALSIADDTGSVLADCPRGAVSATQQALAAAHSAQAQGARAVVARDGSSLTTITTVIPQHGQHKSVLAVARAQKFDSYDRALIRHLTGLASMLLRSASAGTWAETGQVVLAAQLAEQGAPVRHAIAAAYERLSPTGRVNYLVLSADNPARLDRALDFAREQLDRAGQVGFAYSDDDAAVLALRALPELPALLGRHLRGVKVSVLADVRWQDFDADVLAAASVHARSLQPGQVEDFEPLAPAWMAAPGTQAALQRRYQSTIAVLTEHDAAQGTELFATLRAFLLADSHVGRTAQALGLHRHTVRARLDKAASLCHIDLANPLVRAEVLLLCVMAP